MNQITDLDEHKRKLFFEQLSPKTTKVSLENYLSAFPIEICKVPLVESGRNKGHGIVIFQKESSINALMKSRPHRIDGQQVEVYRSVPGQGSMKENKGVTTLIVSGITQGSLTKSDLEQYFIGYGPIIDIDIDNQNDSCVVKFKDYDSVDQALLDVPYTIKNVNISLKKGIRNSLIGRANARKIEPIASNNKTSTAPMKSILKQFSINSQVSTVTMPEKTYCIHISNLPPNTDAEILSRKFSWPISSILMNPSGNNSSAPIECWLKNVDDEEMAKRRVQQWNGQTVGGSTIECEVEEEEPEFCDKFRVGDCSKSDDGCNWAHVMCTANGTCSTDCPYGHAPGVKVGRRNQKRNTTYRIKLTGFQTKLTPSDLAQMLHVDKKICYVNRSEDHVGYLVKLNTIKYAQDLMRKWHDQTIDGQKLQCQLELNTQLLTKEALSKSELSLNNDENENDRPQRSGSRPRYGSSVQSSRESLLSHDSDEGMPREVDDQKVNCEGRLYAQAFKSLGKPREPSVTRKASSTENMASDVEPKYRLPSDVPKDQWEVTNKASGNDGKVLRIRGKSDRKRLAVIKIYENEIDGDCYRELCVLQVLKGLPNVAELIEPESTSNNIHQQGNDEANLWIIMERAPGCSLKEFMDRKYPAGIGLLPALQCVQRLIAILKPVHFRGVFHQHLEPENILIEWDSKHTTIDQAHFTLLNFSRAYINSNKTESVARSTAQSWYQAPQANVEPFQCNPTIDASSICAILFYLLTNSTPRHDNGALPHQQEDSYMKIEKQIANAIDATNSTRKQPSQPTQLKTYLTDTFDSGFGFPEHQPWTIGDLECRLESIRELLLPRNAKLDTTDAVFQDLLSIRDPKAPPVSIVTTVHQDMFQKASNAFCQAKRHFLEYNQDRYSWSDGYCTWLDTAQHAFNERRHDDILTYYSFSRNVASNCSVIITCLASVVDNGNVIKLSIASTVNGKMIRIPLGQFTRNQDYTKQLQDDFYMELKNLVLSICKEQKPIQE